MALETEVQALMKKLSHLSEDEIGEVKRAIETAKTALSDKKRPTGFPYIEHVIRVANILADWNTDSETIIAGILHDVLYFGDMPEEQLQQDWSGTISQLVLGVTALTTADNSSRADPSKRPQIFQSLLQTMKSDIRVAIIKLADRMQVCEDIEQYPEPKRSDLVKEMIEIYYKIAQYLGINNVRRTMSEACMPLLYPSDSRRILQEQDAAGPQRLAWLSEMKTAVENKDTTGALEDMWYKPYSLYRQRMFLEHKEEREPAFAFVMIAKDRDACYELLKILHGLYRPMSGKFRDFLASPAENAYQTIQTTVLGPDGTLIAVRIRTQQMEDQENYGVLQKLFKDPENRPGFSWLQTDGNSTTKTDFWRRLETDIFQKQISVTVNGSPETLSAGCTVLDAVYIHFGADAHHTKKIEKDGVPCHLSSTVDEGDTIAVELGTKPQLAQQWLQWITTAHARNLITASLKEQGQQELKHIGQQLLQQEFDSFKKGSITEMPKSQKQQLCERYQRGQFEDVLTMIGEGLLQPRDVVLNLFPEHQTKQLLESNPNEAHYFHLQISSAIDSSHNILPQIAALAHVHNTNITKTTLRQDDDSHTCKTVVHGISDNRLFFADFLAALKRQEDVSSVQVHLSHREQAFMVGAFILAFGVITLTTMGLGLFEQLTFIPKFLRTILPLIPIIGAAYILLNLLRKHFITLRRDRSYIGWSFTLNLFGVAMLIFQSTRIEIAISILPLLATFVLSIFIIAYRFFQTEALIAPPVETTEALSDTEWKTLKKNKMIGYSIRIGAVIIWGIQPLFHKYTPVVDVDPFIRLFFIGIGAVLVSAVLFPVRAVTLATNRKADSLRISVNPLLIAIVISIALYMYFVSVSLRLTTSTNFLLLNNFSPVLALLVAAILWRSSIPYLKDPKHMLWIFLVFLLGSTGGSLVIYNTMVGPTSGSLYGDLLSLLAMIADTVLVIAQIRYFKLYAKTLSILMNFTMFVCVTLSMLPMIIYLYVTGAESIVALTGTGIFYATAAGALLGIGEILNFEAFKRIDGFIAFLMFNISILITFMAEMVFFKTLQPTILLILGGIIIIGSTIIAEMINSHCEREGL